MRSLFTDDDTIAAANRDRNYIILKLNPMEQDYNNNFKATATKQAYLTTVICHELWHVIAQEGKHKYKKSTVIDNAEVMPGSSFSRWAQEAMLTKLGLRLR